MYGVRRGLRTAGAVHLSWIFSGLGIRQFSVYVVFCNKDVI